MFRRTLFFMFICFRLMAWDYLQVPQPFVPVLVIGSGPAGLAAAFQTARANLYTVVVTGHNPGGQLVGSINVENILGFSVADGVDIMNNLEKQIQDAGVKFLDDVVTSIEYQAQDNVFLIRTERYSFFALAIVIATGASPLLLNVPGEERFKNRFYFTCAFCDSGKVVGKDVVIVGGGDSAVNSAMILAPHVRSITLVVRKESLRASAKMQEALKSYKHVNIKYQTRVIELLGDDILSGVLLEDVQGIRTVFPCGGVFVTIGHQPNSSLFHPHVLCDENNYIKLLGRSQKTSHEGIFAAGEVADNTYRLVAVALGDGTKAGCDVTDYLHQNKFYELDMLDGKNSSLFFTQGLR